MRKARFIMQSICERSALLMRADLAITILEHLLDGVHPDTGECFPEDHVCLEPSVMRALHAAILALRRSVEIPSQNDTNAGRKWTPEDCERLKALYACATPMEDICRILNRRPRSVQNQLTELGLLFPDDRPQNPNKAPGLDRAGCRWTPGEKQRLSELFIEQLPLGEIAAALQRTEHAIQCQMRVLGLIEETEDYLPEGGIERIWLPQDTETLVNLFQQGESIENLAAFFDRSEASIRARLFHAGKLNAPPVVLRPGKNAPHPVDK